MAEKKTKAEPPEEAKLANGHLAPDLIAVRLRGLSENEETLATVAACVRVEGLAFIVFLLTICDTALPINEALQEFDERYCGRYYGLGRAQDMAMQIAKKRAQGWNPRRSSALLLDEATIRRQAETDFVITRAEGMCYLFTQVDLSVDSAATAK